jgi:hypothetical protein
LSYDYVFIPIYDVACVKALKTNNLDDKYKCSQRKRDGGFGLKCLEDWNRLSMLRHSWNLFACSGSIWIA